MCTPSETFFTLSLIRASISFVDDRASIRELAHLVGHHRESPTVLARPSGLDRGVEGKEVGLVRDIGDDIHDPADLLPAFADVVDALHHLVHGLRSLDGLVDGLGGQGRDLRQVL